MKSYSGVNLGGYIGHHYINNSLNGTAYLENFKYPNTADFEYQFSHDPEKELVSVRVEPGETVLKIIKKLSITAKADFTYNNSFIGSDEYNEKECKDKGKKKIVMTSEKKESKCYMYVSQHDFGYVFLFENNEEELRFDGYIAFSSLTNIEPDNIFKNDSGEKCWHIVLKPGESKYCHARRQDPTCKFGIAHKSSFKLLGLDEKERNFD